MELSNHGMNLLNHVQNKSFLPQVVLSGVLIAAPQKQLIHLPGEKHCDVFLLSKG
jgi:hypothetical protein